MGWNDIDNKMKKRTDSLFVSCTEKWEMDYIKKVIKEEFPQHSETEIENAIEECCKEVVPPRPRADFLKCLQSKL